MNYQIQITQRLFDIDDNLLKEETTVEPTVYDTFADAWYATADKAHQIYFENDGAPCLEMEGGHDRSTVKFRTFKRYGNLFPDRVEIEVRYIEAQESDLYENDPQLKEACESLDRMLK